MSYSRIVEVVGKDFIRWLDTLKDIDGYTVMYWADDMNGWELSIDPLGVKVILRKEPKPGKVLYKHVNFYFREFENLPRVYKGIVWAVEETKSWMTWHYERGKGNIVYSSGNHRLA